MKYIKTSVEREGQPYIDEPVFVIHQPKPVSQLTKTLSIIFGSPMVRPIEELSHYNRVRLRWMKPDGRGGLVPR